jgi:hypothetical protein
MKRIDYNAVPVLTGDLEKDVSQLDSLLAENKKAEARIAAGAIDSLDYAALGYTIHNIYCLMENVDKRPGYSSGILVR